MLTKLTQAAVALLFDIYDTGTPSRSQRYALSTDIQSRILSKLESAGLVRLVLPEEPGELSSYQPARNIRDISLLDILEATGEHLNCNQPTTEKFYMRYGRAAIKLGVVNHMTRLYLKEIKLPDL